MLIRADVNAVDALRRWLPKQRRPRGYRFIYRALPEFTEFDINPALAYLLANGEVTHSKHSGWSYLPPAVQLQLRAAAQ